MQTYVSTTPFGRRTMTLAQISSQMTAKAASPGSTAHKWQVFKDIRLAREVLVATDRSLAILNALLTFHPHTSLSCNDELIVWPSNEQLAARANGMPATTLRRHIAVLVDCGLIIRRDSPNGKRFARKGRGGEIEQAYGFDLTPIVSRAQELSDLANAVQAEKKSFRVAKERLTLLRRDIVKLIASGIEEDVPGNWARVQQAYQAIVGRLPRSAPRQLVEDICIDLHGLYTEILDVLETFTESQKTDGNESQIGRHIQNSKPEPSSESESGSREKKEAGGNAAETHNIQSLPKRDLPLGIVLEACSNLRELARDHDIPNWREFLVTAELARPMLGVSPSAWLDAKKAMGERHAAIALAAIYQRSERISNPGGYLRSLAAKAENGQFSTWPMVMALLNSGIKAGRSPNEGVASPTEAYGGEPRLQVSNALLESLKKPRG